MIDLFAINWAEIKKDPNARKDSLSAFWRVLFQSLKDAQTSSAVAEAVTAPFLRKIETEISTELRDSQKKQLEERKAAAAMQVDGKEEKPIMILTHEPAKIIPTEEIVGESAMLKLLIDYLMAEDQTNFALV